MKQHGATLLLIALLGVLVAGLALVFRLRLTAGDVFPAYSSLRADPLGTRALYESLSALPGLRVARNFRPLDGAEPTPPRTLILAGTAKEQWHHLTREQFDALDAAVKAGCRLVITFKA